MANQAPRVKQQDSQNLRMPNRGSLSRHSSPSFKDYEAASEHNLKASHDQERGQARHKKAATTLHAPASANCEDVLNIISESMQSIDRLSANFEERLNKLGQLSSFVAKRKAPTRR